MKNTSHLRKLFSWIIVFIVGTLKLLSQPDFSGIEPIGVFVNGCIITNQGDTLYGKLKMKSKFVENNISQIQFKENMGEGDIFDAGTIRGFGIDRSSFRAKKEFQENIWDYYESKPSFKKGIMVFMNRFESGKIAVFQNRSSMGVGTTVSQTHSKIDGISFSWSSDEGLYIGPSYRTTSSIILSKNWYSSYYVKKGSGDLIKVEKANYEELWPNLFGDCTDIQKEVDKSPELKQFKNFIVLVNVYNRICN